MKTVLKLFGILGLCVVALFALIVVGGEFAGAQTPKKPKLGAPDVSVRHDAWTLRVKNNGTAGWETAEIFINGQPPFTYRIKVAAPSVGEEISIPLNEFATKSGDRFDPRAKKLTEIWVGGGGYDYQKFR